LLELKNIWYSPEDNKESVKILRDINLTLEDNRFYVITGPNGGGKSSLAKIIMGIYKPTAGKILFNGRDITDATIYERAKMGIGYAFQQPPRFKGITVKELLNLAKDKNFTGSGCNRLFDVGLCPKDYEDREVNASLSGGELKRIEIASLLGRNCKIAVFDEPEAGIDLWSFTRLTDIFEKIHNKKEVTTVIISHQERILKLADEIILLAEGEIQGKGETEGLLDQIIDRCDCRKDCREGSE
jgi:Fe-S cluster assembly ATP-binding protein